MTNNEPIHAERGVPMKLQTINGFPYNWDGERLVFLNGTPAGGKEKEWGDQRSGYSLYTRPDGELVLPPKDEPDAIEVGSQWKNTNYKNQVAAREVVDGVVHFACDNGTLSHLPAKDFLEQFTHLFTPAKDLSNVPDGAKIVGFDGEVVTCEHDGGTGSPPTERNIFLFDSGGDFHSVNGLPAYVNIDGEQARIWYRHGVIHREEGPARFWLNPFNPQEPEQFLLFGGNYSTPAEWGREIATNPAYDASKVLPEYRHLLPPPRGGNPVYREVFDRLPKEARAELLDVVRTGYWEMPEEDYSDIKCDLLVSLVWDEVEGRDEPAEEPEPETVVAEVGMDVVVVFPSGEKKRGVISVIYDDAVLVDFEKSHTVVHNRDDKTITHNGRPVVLPDHIPDGGEKGGDYIPEVRKMIEEPAPYSVRHRGKSHHYETFLECDGEERPIAKFVHHSQAEEVAAMLNAKVAKEAADAKD